MGEVIRTDCCVVGGGPAGMMLGLLLARAGVAVTVLEKHADFLRDFRGDTVHASTLEVMEELGWLEAFLACPHQQMRELAVRCGGQRVAVADFSGLATKCKFVALMPQWEFLNFLAERARGYDGFELRMQAEATALVEENGRVAGVRALGPEGELEVRAALTVGADGRHSKLRALAGIKPQELGAPMDVLWLRLPREEAQGALPLFNVGWGNALVLLERGEYWQCGLVIAKGGREWLEQQGLDHLRAMLVEMAPELEAGVGAITSWDEVKLLTVAVNRVERWHRPGLLLVGDAAHAMSPVGGVGINLAVQDAVAAANLLWRPLREGRLAEGDLARVQARRERPARRTQAVQVAVQRRVVGRVLRVDLGPAAKLPWPLRVVGRSPRLRRWLGRMVASGAQPEHVSSPSVTPVPIR